MAGEKLNGKNPTNAPANAVINNIDTNGEPFNTNITNNDIADITDIPDERPSSPSIKFIAFVTPTIHPTVNNTENTSLICSEPNKRWCYFIYSYSKIYCNNCC